MFRNLPIRICLAVALVAGSRVASSQEPEPATATKTPESAPAEAVVRIERKSRREATRAFDFEKVPSPSETDAGNLATVTLVRGQADANGGRPLVLRDGALPRGEDQPGANWFLAGTDPGRLLFDFGKPIAIRQINTYSWHPSTRADQRYEVFVPAAEVDPAEAARSASRRTLTSTWKQIASVDSRDAESPAAQIGVSIAAPEEGTLATTRFVLLAIEPTRERTRSCQTFFSEIDFVDGETYPAPEPPKPVIDDLVIDETYTIHFDTTEVPELRDWVKTKLMPACKAWYPRIVEALPSDRYKAPTEFSVRFRAGMQGVAFTRGRDVFCAGPWYMANLETEAVGSVVHELVHVVQQYGLAGDRRPPVWLGEGIADHIRWYQFERPEQRRRINWERANFDDAYFPSATFLDYIVRELDPDAIEKINADCRQGRYDENYWTDRYGKTAEEIWAAATLAGTSEK